jgi:hypothetical protein
MPVESLQTSLDYARQRTTETTRPWSVATGPAAALLLSLERVGWTVHDATNITTDMGREIELSTDPPIVVARLMVESVRRWRWNNVAEAHPSLKGKGCTFDPVLKLLNSKRADDGWNPMLRASLSSVVPNRQYPQERCYRANWVEHPKCIFCLHANVTGSLHTAIMPGMRTKTSSSSGADECTAAQLAPGTTQQQHQQHHLVRPKLPKPMSEPPSNPVHESATAQQIEDTPMGTLAHRNYQCPSLNGERARHAPDAMQQRAARSAEGNLAFERALHPSLNHIVPPPAKNATFNWHIFPEGGCFRGRVYTDGSGLDGPTPLLARNGWAFVVLNESNEVIASASGVPPDWIEDIPAGH